jgi:hypothetical protein
MSIDFTLFNLLMMEKVMRKESGEEKKKEKENFFS